MAVSIRSLQTKIIDAYNNFKPDLLVMGHADRVSLNTLYRLKEIIASQNYY